MPTLVKEITLYESETVSFYVAESGWYLISVKAKVKGERQRGRNETDDEDLTLQFDSHKFPSLSSPNRLLDSPAAFSGGEQHNRDKTVYLLNKLTQGDHTLILTPQYEAQILSVSYEKVEINGNKLELDLNVQASDRDRKPWITFVTIDIPLKDLHVEAITKWRFFDGDDIQMKVNDTILRNTKSIFHRNWVLSAVPIIDTLNGKKEITVALNPKSRLNYIEFFADRKPTLNKLIFSFEITPLKPLIQKYTDSIYNSRDYNRYDDLIIKAVGYWNNFFSQQNYPPTEPLDASLVKAIVYRESKLAYDTDNNGQVDIMQVWNEADPAKATLLSETPEYEFFNAQEYKNMNYSNPSDQNPPQVTIPEESVFWGVRWLYHKAQELHGNNGTLAPPYKRVWVTWEEAIRRYNANPDVVEEYITEVYSIIQNGRDLKGNTLW